MDGCSELVPDGAYEYEFSIESCAGEVEEGLGGKVGRQLVGRHWLG